MKSPTTGEPFARILQSGPRWTGKVELIERPLTLPLKWRKPKRIFVNSLSDLFHEALSDEAIDRVFAVMAMCPQHTFQVLTKRPERMLAYLSQTSGRRVVIQPTGARSAFGAIWTHSASWPLHNCWLGVSVENQTTANARIPLLLQTPAAKRFVSYEPALGPVDFTAIEFREATWYNSLEDHDGFGLLGAAHSKLDQIIVGGESGPGARPFDIEWARNTIRQCKEAGVACFIKQLGPKPYDSLASEQSKDYWPWLRDRKGADMSEWPKDLRTRESPAAL